MLGIELCGMIKGVGEFFVGIFTYRQTLQRNQKLDRANRVNELINIIYNDKDICDVIYLIDYNLTRWYPDFFPNHCPEGYVPDRENNLLSSVENIEPLIDKALKYFSYICYLVEHGVIDESEFNFLRYECDRLLANPQLQDYLFNLYHFVENYNRRRSADKSEMHFPFPHLLDYAKKNGLIREKDFNNSKSDKYHRFLNF